MRKCTAGKGGMKMDGKVEGGGLGVGRAWEELNHCQIGREGMKIICNKEKRVQNGQI